MASTRRSLLSALSSLVAAPLALAAAKKAMPKPAASEPAPGDDARKGIAIRFNNGPGSVTSAGTSFAGPTYFVTMDGRVHELVPTGNPFEFNHRITTNLGGK